MKGSQIDPLPEKTNFKKSSLTMVKRVIDNEIFKANIYRTEAYTSIMCGSFSVAFIVFYAKY